MLILQNLTYLHPDTSLLFDNINLSVNRSDKIALIGNNGVGKSTLLKILAGSLLPSSGEVRTHSKPYYIPQVFGQFNSYSVAEALQVDHKLTALQEVLEGRVTEQNLALLQDDWSIESRCREALEHWKLDKIQLSQQIETLSGGQKTRVFLAGILIHEPDIVLLDEPGNHLDSLGRHLLQEYVQTTTNTLIIVSHERALLNLAEQIWELSTQGINEYGGNYEQYAAQKAAESNAFDNELKSKEKALRKAKEIERETWERQQKLDARGKKKKEKEGVPTIAMNTLRNNAEKSTSRIKGVHAGKIAGLSQELSELRSGLPDLDKMKFNFDHSALHRGKILFSAEDLNHGYGPMLLWPQPLKIMITSGERIAIKGLNGSGKSTLIQIILGRLEPVTGRVFRADNKAVYIDQDYSLVDSLLNVYQQAQQYNFLTLQEHELKNRLNRFLFTRDDWDKSCSTLSGGERMRLLLCCLTVSSQAPDMIILDEPTNNLDMQNLQILATAVNDYQGTLVVVSHDPYFLEAINIQKTIDVAGSE